MSWITRIFGTIGLVVLTSCNAPEAAPDTAPPLPAQISAPTPSIVEWKTFESALCGFRFSHPSDYVVTEQRTSQDCSVTVAEPSAPMQDDAPNDAPSESPPSIGFLAFKGSTGKRSLKDWVQRSKRSIGYDAEQWGALQELSIAGTDAVAFTMDGLYAVHRIVLAHNGRVVTADGPFRGEHDPLHLAFSRMLTSLELRMKDGTLQSSACKDLGPLCDTLQLPTCVDGHWRCVSTLP